MEQKKGKSLYIKNPENFIRIHLGILYALCLRAYNLKDFLKYKTFVVNS